MIRENSTKIGRVLFCFLLLRARVVFLFVLLRLGWGGGWSVGRDRPATNQSVALFKWPSTAGDVIAKDAGWPDRGARSRRAPMAAAGWRWGRRLGLGRWRWLALSRSPAGVPNGRSCLARSSAVSPRTVRTVRRRHRLVNGQVTCYRSRSTRFSRRHHRRTVSLAVSGRPTVALSLQCLSPGARFGCTCRRSAPPVGRHRRRRPVHRCGAGSPAPFFFLLAKFSVAHCRRRRRRLVFGGAPAGPRWRLIGFPSDAERRPRRRRRPMWSERCQMPLDSPFVPPGPKNPPRWRPIFAHAMQMRLFSTVHVVLPRCPFPFLLQDAVLMVGVQGGGVRGRPGPKATGAQRWRSFSVQRGVDFGTFSFLIFWFFLAAAAHRFLIASRISMADVHLFSVCVAP